TIRIATDPAAIDRQLTAFEKGQDPFRQKLAELIGQQGKVREGMEKLAAKYATLDEKIKAYQAESKAKARENAAGNAGKPPTPAASPLQMDPETIKQLQALRQELAQWAKLEEANVRLGQQVDQDLAKSAE